MSRQEKSPIVTIRVLRCGLFTWTLRITAYDGTIRDVKVKPGDTVELNGQYTWTPDQDSIARNSSTSR